MRPLTENEEYFGKRIKLYPSEQQKQRIDSFIDANRYGYNWALEQNMIQEKLLDIDLVDFKTFGEHELDKMFTQHKKEKGIINDIPVSAYRSGIRRCVHAFKIFHKNSNVRHPKFKSKKHQGSKQSVETRADKLYFVDDYVKIDGMKDKIYIKMHTGLTSQTSPKVYSTVITRTNTGEYFLSYQIIRTKPARIIKNNNPIIGIDLNVKKGFVTSCGDVFIRPDKTKVINKIKKLQRACRKDYNRLKNLEITNPDVQCEPSRRSLKRKDKLRKAYRHLANIEENFIQTSTTKIIRHNPSKIVMEDLNVNKMWRTHYIVSKMMYAAFYRCREVMTYKCNRYNIPIQFAPKDYPSSQLCSRCGNRKTDHNHRTYICPVCGLKIDRDLNAALNLAKL